MKKTQKRSLGIKNSRLLLILVSCAALLIGGVAGYQLGYGNAAKPVRSGSTAVATPGIFFGPSTTTANVGDVVVLQIRANSGTEPVNAVQASLTYPATVLEFVALDTSQSAFAIEAQSSQTTGSVTVVRAVSGGAELTGEQPVATISFRVIQKAEATIQFDATTALVSASTNQNILTTSNSKGTAQIQPPRGKR